MGKEFGKLYKMRGIITYKISPYEQKAFAGFFKHGFPNLLRRFRSQVFFVGPPFITGYLLYNWGENEAVRLARKNPADYVNDV